MATLYDILGQIRQRESGGNYGLTPQQNYDYPNSHASGAYQIQPATWNAWTAASGIGTQYSQAYLAPPSVQDAVAGWAVEKYGANSPYTWAASAPSGGYPSVTGGDASSSTGSGLPGPLGGLLGGGKPGIYDTTGAGGGTGAQPGGGTGAQPGGGTGAQPGGSTAQNTGPGAPVVITDITSAGSIGAGLIKEGLGNVQSGLKTTAQSISTSEQNAAQTATGITNTGLSAIADWFIRGGIGLLGILLLVLGLWIMGRRAHA